MRVFTRNHLFFLVCAAAFAGGTALAQESDHNGPPRDGRGGHHHKPPAAAFEACAELEEDADCTVTLKDRTIEGHCLQAPDEERLVCVPEHMGPPPHGGERPDDQPPLER